MNRREELRTWHIQALMLLNLRQLLQHLIGHLVIIHFLAIHYVQTDILYHVLFISFGVIVDVVGKFDGANGSRILGVGNIVELVKQISVVESWVLLWFLAKFQLVQNDLRGL